MKKQVKNILVIIFFIPLLLGTSVNITEAFLDTDLGLNLYRDLDEGLSDFEEKQYIYELSDQDKNNITDNVNKILIESGIGECLKEGANEKVISGIADGKIEILTQNMKEECYDSTTQTFKTKQIGDMMKSIAEIKNYYQNTAKNKAKAIHEVSRIGMYTDGDINNSPFDLIKDIQDINEINIIDEIDYEGEDLNFLTDYKENPFIPNLGAGSNSGGNGNSGNSDSGVDDNGSNPGNSDGENNGNENGGEDSNNESDTQTPDGNTYLCSENINQSGLDDDSLSILTDNLGNDELGNNDLGYTFEYGGSGHINLPETNQIGNIPSLSSPNYSTELLSQGLNAYESVNDNNQWECNQFFCIVVDFIINKHNLLDYGQNKSIENIIETSNKHLKKAANHSLVQSKMTTNNFEMSLRDLDLPSIFHMGMVVTTMAPPILNLENLINNSGQNSKTESEKDSDDENIIKQMISDKYDSYNLKYNDSNNLNKFRQMDSELKNIIKSLSNSSKRAKDLRNEYKELQTLKQTINSYTEKKVNNEINNNILTDFDQQYSELEQFNKNILNYIDSLDILIKNLNKIKTYSG